MSIDPKSVAHLEANTTDKGRYDYYGFHQFSLIDQKPPDIDKEFIAGTIYPPEKVAMTAYRADTLNKTAVLSCWTFSHPLAKYPVTTDGIKNILADYPSCHDVVQGTYKPSFTTYYPELITTYFDDSTPALNTTRYPGTCMQNIPDYQTTGCYFRDSNGVCIAQFPIGESGVPILGKDKKKGDIAATWDVVLPLFLKACQSTYFQNYSYNRKG